MDNSDNNLPQRPPLGRPLGIPLGDDTQEQTRFRPKDEPATQPVNGKPAKDGKGGGRTWLIVLIVGLLLGGLGAGAYFLFGKDNKKSHADDEDDEETVEDVEEMDDEEEAALDEDTYDASADVYEDEEQYAAPEEAEEAVEVAAPVGPSQLVLNGDADGYPLRLELNIDGEQVSGTYTNLTSGTTMNVSGTMAGGAIRLTGRADNTTYTFRIMPEGHLYVGTFSSAAGTTLELHLTEQL